MVLVVFMLPQSVKVRIKRVDLLRDRGEFMEDCVVTETPVLLYVNGEHIATFMALPSQLKELCVGWLLTQSLVDSIDEIENVSVRGGKVHVRCSRNVKVRVKALGSVALIDSACGSEWGESFQIIDRILKPFVDSKYYVKAADILGFVKTLNENSRLFKLTGGTHAAALFHNGEMVAFAEDVGRHNAVDKVVGGAAMGRINFSRSVLVSTGRQTANMVLKAARVGIPIVASIAAPLHSGIVAAEKTGVTLVCFVRGKRMNIYSHHERITFN